MPTDNYFKVFARHPRRVHETFFFDTRDPKSVREALEEAVDYAESRESRGAIPPAISVFTAIPGLEDMSGRTVSVIGDSIGGAG